MITSKTKEPDIDYSNPWKRLNTLYKIVEKRGAKIPFTCNWAQEELYRNTWYCNIILKARQLGISTFVCLLFLDRCLFNPNVSAGIICHTREDAEHMFKRIKFAYDNLPDVVKRKKVATVDSARELVFSNGSSLRVGTSMRGSTLQYLHISEFGKISAKYPDKAAEVISGSLNTLEAGQYVFIESTAEGRSGYFYDICKKAEDMKKMRADLSELDFRFHFFPWHKEPGYRIGSPIVIQEDMLEYFESLRSRGVELDEQQKYWYCAKLSTQGDKMMKEYPSTPDEAWEQSNEGLYYGRWMSAARLEKRICFVPYDEELPVSTAWDLGYNDSTAIWFVQTIGKEIRLIDYIEGSGESLSHWLGVVKNKPYVYDKHLAPHDVALHEYSTGTSRQSFARKMGINFVPVQKTSIISGIDAVRGMLNRCWFDEKRCATGLKALDAYKKEWDDKHGCWRSQPLHNWASHGCFVAETLIDCSGGMKKISDIVVGDFVKTPNGYKRVLKHFEYKSNDLIKVITTSSKFICTKNHKVFAEKGLVFADSLGYNDVLFSNKEEDILLCKIIGSCGGIENIGFRDNFLSMKMKDQLYLMDSCTDGVDIITEGTPIQNQTPFQVCIERFGHSITEKFQEIITSIISMVIPKTMIFQTCNACIGQSIWNWKLKRISGLEVRKISSNLGITTRKQKNGIEVQRVSNGIRKMGKKLGLIERSTRKSALFVKKYTKLHTLIDQNFAVINANPNTDTFLESLMKKERVKSALRYIQQENTQSRERVLKIVPMNFKEEQKVYDICVEDDHCYYANGILVSNSDAFRTLAVGMTYLTGPRKVDSTTIGGRSVTSHLQQTGFR